MSWLNFNDSLNNIKGQISNFANTVLNENIPGTETDASNNLNKSETFEEVNEDGTFREEVSWAWSTDESKTDQLKTDETITNLKKKIIDLENENRELITSLDQLDQNHQQNTEGLVKIKEKLSEELEHVTEKYELLNMKYNKLALAENAYKKRINELKNKCENNEVNVKIQELEDENKALRIALSANKEQHSSEDYEVLICKLQETQEKLETSQRCMEKLREILKDYTVDESEFEDIPENVAKTLGKFEEKFNELESKIFEINQTKTDLPNEKNVEIEKLIENSEMLTRELMTKSKEIKDLEEECEQLMKNNEILIEKLNEKTHTQQLQTIFESNEDNVEKIEELEIFRRKLGETEEERDKLREILEKTRSDFESSEYQFSEIKISFENLCEDLEKHKTRIDLLENENKNLKNQKEKIEELQEKIRELELKLREKNEENETKIEEVEGLKFKENEIEKLKQELNEEKSKNLEISEENEKFRRVSQNLREKEEECLDLKNENGEISRKIDEISKELQEKNELLARIGKEIEEFQSFKTKIYEIFGKNEDDQKIIEHIQNLKIDTGKSQELDELIRSRNELIGIVQTKHQETLTYHAEIQRLNEILKNETEKNIQLEKRITEISSNELEKLNDQIEFLKEKCDILTKNLLENEEKSNEKEAGLMKKLERLQNHLVEVEEHYTQELLQGEQKITLLQAKLNEAEQREKDSSTIYTSVSIRANQQNEALQQQLQSMTSQRDEYKRKLSEMEDENNVKTAALTNLQLVLEQFQRDREADVVRETERIRKQLKVEQKIQQDLRNEIIELENRMQESKQGLQAASRLTDQLEMSKNQISSLKEEVTILKEKLVKKEEELTRITGQTEGKVDKSLIKNLIIGFVTSNKNLNRDQTQILKIIATVLDFNEQDHNKVNLNQAQQNSWLKSLLAPSTSYDDENSLSPHESLSRAFVNFLENESKPRVIPSLLPSNNLVNDLSTNTGATSNSSTSSSRKNSRTTTPSPIVLNEIVLPTFSDFPQHRNSSSILKGVLKTNMN